MFNRLERKALLNNLLQKNPQQDQKKTKTQKTCWSTMLKKVNF